MVVRGSSGVRLLVEPVVGRALLVPLSRAACLRLGEAILLAATFVLYFLGGEALRSFSYCFIVGVLTGTYSSVAIGAPLVWSRNLDPTINPETSSPLQSRGLSTT